MKLRIFAISLLALCIQTCFAQTLKRDLQARYRGFERAIQTHDTKFLNAYLSPTFTASLPNGQTVNRDDTLKAFNDFMSAVNHVSWTFDLSNETIVPRGVTVTAKGHTTGTAIGPDKKRHHIDLKGETEDTWVLQGNTWVLDHVSFRKLNGTVDGRPAPIPGLSQ